MKALLGKLAAKVDCENRIKANPEKGYTIGEELMAVHSKFYMHVDRLFNGLPKPKDWISFATNDLPLLFTDDDVQRFAMEQRLNKSQTKAVAKHHWNPRVFVL